MRLFSLRSHFGNSLAFILFVWSISFEPVNLIIVKAPLYTGVPELADQIETVYSLMVMKVKNVYKNIQGATAF
jgi:hypothetical protein